MPSDSDKAKQRTYKAVKSASLSSAYDERFVIVDAKTREVLDDAQGYGYKSPQKAHAAWGYKNRTPQQKTKADKIAQWLRKNKTFCQELETCSWYAFKDGDDLKASDVAVIIEREYENGNISGEVPGTAAEIYRVWRSGNYRKTKRKKKSKR